MKRASFALAFFSLTLPAFGQGVDPLIGTWKLNLEKSTAFGFALTKSTTLTWSGEGQHFINTAEGVDAQGQSFKMIFRHIYDGHRHPTTGNPEWDATAYTRIGNTINILRFRQGKAISVEQAVIVPSKTYTLTIEGIDSKGQSYHGVEVYDRQ